MRRKLKLDQVKDVENTTIPYLFMEGMPVKIEEDGFIKNRAHLPFVCRRCKYPLQAQQNHKLAKKSRTPVICLGTCLEALMKNEKAIQELNLNPSEPFGNVWSIPDEIVAEALSYSIEGDSHAPPNLDETP